jgi:H+-transporting ATPase
MRIYKAQVENGLTSAQVDQTRLTSGFNEETQVHTPIWKRLGKHFIGVAPIILELTFIASLALKEWIEAGVVIALLLFNVVIGFIQDTRAARAMDQLQSSLHIQARVLRDGVWSQIPARELVPSDIVQVRQGDMIPADLYTFEGDLMVDQSSLTGESNAVSKPVRSRVFAGSVATKGEAHGLVVFTGLSTKFNTTLHLVQMSAPKLHMSRVIAQIVAVEMTTAGILILVAIIVLLVDPVTRDTFGSIVPLLLVLFALSAPVTLPPMITLTLALGSQTLAAHHVLTVRLNAIEDAANMTVLCTDKTGTLTMNKLSVITVLPLNNFAKEDVLLYAAGASRHENNDAIDEAVLNASKEVIDAHQFEQTEFVPFSAATRKTVGVMKFLNDESVVKSSKGAVNTLMDDCNCKNDIRASVAEAVASAGLEGHRVIAVAGGTESSFRLAGLLVMADPPRADTKDTVDKLHSLGIRVIMLTGDAIAIGRSVAHETGIGDDIRTWHKDMDLPSFGSLSGLAEIFPEDKHAFVRFLQTKQKEIVGMTGDGVNDAAALKQAEVGVAMFNATDVAKGASSVVLLDEGLGAVPVLVEIGR